MFPVLVLTFGLFCFAVVYYLLSCVMLTLNKCLCVGTVAAGEGLSSPVLEASTVEGRFIKSGHVLDLDKVKPLL